jgi:hypothetical protein
MQTGIEAHGNATEQQPAARRILNHVRIQGHQAVVGQDAESRHDAVPI